MQYFYFLFMVSFIIFSNIIDINNYFNKLKIASTKKRKNKNISKNKNKNKKKIKYIYIYI